MIFNYDNININFNKATSSVLSENLSKEKVLTKMTEQVTQKIINKK